MAPMTQLIDGSGFSCGMHTQGALTDIVRVKQGCLSKLVGAQLVTSAIVGI